MITIDKISIIIPAKNESDGLGKLLPRLCELFPEAEIIIVNDGSTDNTINVCQKYPVIIINHLYSRGNGAAIKSGARRATGDFLVFMDADGQHSPDYIQSLIEHAKTGYDMVVGERDYDSQAGIMRHLANWFYNKFASWVTGHKIPDLTSGFRLVVADKFREFMYLLPNGFSYPTTITMAMFRSGYSVGYVPIKMPERDGDSHIRPISDGIRFLLIIFKVGTLYAPLKFFFPVSGFVFFTGLSYYIYTYMHSHSFTNMGLLILLVSVLIFLIGLISEQLTVLLYINNQRNNSDRN